MKLNIINWSGLRNCDILTPQNEPHYNFLLKWKTNYNMALNMVALINKNCDRLIFVIKCIFGIKYKYKKKQKK